MKMGSGKYAVLLTLILALCTSAVLAGETSGKGRDSGVQYYWYDGDIRRVIQLETQPEKSTRQVAEHPGETAAASTSEGEPAFREDGQLKTLPGGVIVKFSPTWDSGQIAQWMSDWGFTDYRPLGASHTWIIATEAGLSSLELANRIHESGEVIYASPNWSVERQRR